MTKNVGTVDKVIRIIVGLALLSLLYFLDGPMQWLGLIGIIPIATALMNFCPLYTLIGLKTCPVRSDNN